MCGIAGIAIEGPGISIRMPPSRSCATSVACFVSVPRRYSTRTVSPGSSLRAGGTRPAPRPGLVLVFGLEAAERGARELGDDVAHLEPRLVGGATGRHAFDLGADLVALGAGVGPDDDADPTAVVAERKRKRARRPRGPRSTGRRRRLLGREPGCP